MSRCHGGDPNANGPAARESGPCRPAQCAPVMPHDADQQNYGGHIIRDAYYPQVPPAGPLVAAPGTLSYDDPPHDPGPDPRGSSQRASYNGG